VVNFHYLHNRCCRDECAAEIGKPELGREWPNLGPSRKSAFSVIAVITEETTNRAIVYRALGSAFLLREPLSVGIRG
jgi:hypothetical protein